jgi:hypothetical protein
MGKTTTFDPETIRSAFALAPDRFRAGKVRHVCRELGCSPGTVNRAACWSTTRRVAFLQH